MTRNRALCGAIVLVLVAAAVAVAATGSAGASAGDAGNQIAGTLNVTLHRPAPLPALVSLQVFTSDGSWIEASSEPPATRTPQFGSWERIDGRLYAASGTFLRFDPATGAHVGTMKINRTMRLSQDGQSMAVVARATLYDLNGNVVTSFPVVATGEPTRAERIPAEP